MNMERAAITKVKAAIKREQSDACISYAEREQVRCETSKVKGQRSKVKGQRSIKKDS